VHHTPLFLGGRKKCRPPWDLEKVHNFRPRSILPHPPTMSSFFTAPSTQKKRKRPETSELPKKRFAASKPAREKPAPRRPKRDESISGSDEESDAGLDVTFEDNEDVSGSSGSEVERETAAEKRLRLAERYLENVREEVDEVRILLVDGQRGIIWLARQCRLTVELVGGI